MVHMVRTIPGRRKGLVVIMVRHRLLVLYVVLGLSLLSSRLPANAADSANGVLHLRDGWRMESSCKVEKPGEQISTPAFSDATWYSVTAPTTVVSALVKLKKYPDPDFGMNLRKLPGVTYPIGENFSNIPMRQDSPFMVPWWFRKTFVLPAADKGKTLWLYFGGINYRANIFLNGKQIGTYDDVAGAWRTYEFNITDAALPG